MLRNLFLVLIAVISIQYAVAQSWQNKTRKPDYDAIEKTIKDTNSPFFYATLMKRYESGDTTLSTEDYRYLYYGSATNENYIAYGSPVAREKLNKVKDIDKIIKLEKEALAEFPFNLRDIYNLYLKLDEKGEKEEAAIYYKKMMGIAQAIMSTGDGQTDSTAMYVVNVGHEYDMIGLLGYKFSGPQILIRKTETMDKMGLAKNDDGLDYLYFNVDALFSSYKRMFKKD